jgi:hypothetical protein
MAQSETISGIVATSNPQGLQLQGRPEWFNYSVKAEPPLRRAAVGEYVQLSVTRDARGTAYWINGYVEQAAAAPAPSPPAPSASPAANGGAITPRDELMARMSALKSATALAAQVPGITAGDVIQVAALFLTWLTAR